MAFLASLLNSSVIPRSNVVFRFCSSIRRVMQPFMSMKRSSCSPWNQCWSQLGQDIFTRLPFARNGIDTFAPHVHRRHTPTMSLGVTKVCVSTVICSPALLAFSAFALLFSCDPLPVPLAVLCTEPREAHSSPCRILQNHFLCIPS